MANIIVTGIILAIVIAAIAKIVIEKRKGAKCVGCPYSKIGNSSCGCGKQHKYTQVSKGALLNLGSASLIM